MEYYEMFPEFADQLKEEYGLHDMKIIKTKYIAEYYSVFIITPTEKLLEDIWEKLNSTIAVELTPHFNTEYELWNMYLFFLSQEDISNTLKFKIEHNKFSSRKIVADVKSTGLDMVTIDQLISKYITNEDITISEVDNLPQTKENSYSNDSTIYKLIEKCNLKSTKSANKENVEKLYSEIIKEIKHEIKKG